MSNRGEGCTRLLLVVLLCMVLGGSGGESFAQSKLRSVPMDLIGLDAETLIRVKLSYQRGETMYRAAVEKLKRDAVKALSFDPVSVVDKAVVPPSGDRHDYLSQSRYWWPDPDKPDGLPFVNRDGETNPDAAEIKDHENMGTMIRAVHTLALGFFFHEEERFVVHARELLRAWFLSPETRMNPHLRYSQLIPGRDVVRGTGILDGRGFSHLVNAVGLLRLSPEWSNEEEDSLKAWFAQYLEWLLTSEQGEDEAGAKNNHGTWYDVQAASIAHWVGRRDVARNIVEEARMKRIEAQIEPDGRQRQELVRTLSLHYSLFNLQALTQLAAIARSLRIDLWRYEGNGGRSIARALDFLVPYLKKERAWEYEQRKSIDKEEVLVVYAAAWKEYGNGEYGKIVREYGGEDLEEHRAVALLGLQLK